MILRQKLKTPGPILPQVAVALTADILTLINRKSLTSFSSKRQALSTLASTKRQASSTLASFAMPIVELRRYQLYPTYTSLYAQATIESSHLRSAKLPIAFFGYTETGAIPLNTVVHLYHYPGGHKQRHEQRLAIAEMDEWKQYLTKVKACMMEQSSEIFLEAGFLEESKHVSGLKSWVESQPNNTSAKNRSVVELRKYQLQLGYDIVPRFSELYSKALPFKQNARGMHPTTQLVTVLVSNISSLNTVYEVWKHGDQSFCGFDAMEQSRQASRGVKEWSTGIAEIAKLSKSFECTVLKPTEFSPLK